MRTAVDQLPLFRRLPIPKTPPGPPPWRPRPWARAVLRLWKLPKPLLRLIQPELHLVLPRGPQKRVQFTIDPDTLPYAVKPSKVIWMIQTAPPPKPLCFDSTAQWQEWLMYAHAEGQQITRRQDTGRHSGRRVVVDVFDTKRLDYCADCTASHMRKMQGEKRCIVPATP